MSTVVFSGGVGAARFLSGLVQAIDPTEITVISNVGDDSVFWGLYVCPDIDIVIYTLAGLINQKTGWGLTDDTFTTLRELHALGEDTWFNLGDRDLATQIYRTNLLGQGLPLSEITARLTKARGLACKILPATDDRLETRFLTPDGELAFQEYMVKRSWKVPIQKVIFKGADVSRPAPGVLDAIAAADRVLFAPSNPFISIGTILAVPGIRQALLDAKAPVAAVSPIVGGQAIKGPAADLMRDFGYEVSAYGVAQVYRDLVDLLVIDQQDTALLPKIQALGLNAIATDTMMTSPERKKQLAADVINAVDAL